jgi:hypothetical protein
MDFSAVPEGRGRLCTYDSKFNPASSDYQMIQLRLPATLSVEEKQQLEAIAIFPTGVVVHQETDEFFLYYGAADSSVGLAIAHMSKIKEYLLSCPTPRSSE